ncbi:MAG: vWA domain-containing protein [Candidatus Dormibacteria bacterium]
MWSARQRYSRWDGSQEEDAPAADDVFSRLAEDVFHGWDFESALRRLLSQGFKDQEGRRLPGLEGLLQQLRQRRQQQLQRYHLDDLFQDIAERLDGIVRRERETLEKRLEDARGRADGSLAARTASSRLSQLDQLPPEPGSAIGELQNYEFLDSTAEGEFRELLAELRRNLVESHFRRLGQNLQQLGPEQMAQMQAMVTDLNQMLERHLRGEPAGYDDFMAKWGGLFPDHPDDLAQFLAQLERRQEELNSLLQSMSPEARRQLRELLQGALSDEALQAELEQLARLLAQLAPDAPRAGEFEFFGGEELGFPEALDMMGRLQQLEALERGVSQAFRGEPMPASLLEQLDSELGPQAAAIVHQVQELLAEMERRGELRRGEAGPELTPQGVRRIGHKALRDIFQHLRGDRFGGHQLARAGIGGDRGDESKVYEFGDPFTLEVQRTVMNAIRRGEGLPPLHLELADFEVVRPEQTVNASTVLMLDMSRSMPLRGYFYAAKKMALGLDALIRSQYPRDSLYVVGFSDYAREIPPGALAQLSYSEYVYGTNMQHGLMLARHLLNRHRGGNRQIIIVSDGEPTAHMEGDRAVFFYPPLPETFQKTLLEVKRCTQEKIVINTFMLESNSFLVQFVKQITRLNRGRAFFVSPDRLGDYVLVDYVSSRTRPG